MGDPPVRIVASEADFIEWRNEAATAFASMSLGIRRSDDAMAQDANRALKEAGFLVLGPAEHDILDAAGLGDVIIDALDKGVANG